jgi:hypothetical protein
MVMLPNEATDRSIDGRFVASERPAPDASGNPDPGV